MSTTGAVKRMPSGVRRRSGTASRHHGSGASPGITSSPARRRTPAPGDAGQRRQRVVGPRRPLGHAVLRQRAVGVPERGGHGRGRLLGRVAGDDVGGHAELAQAHGDREPDHPGADHDHPHGPTSPRSGARRRRPLAAPLAGQVARRRAGGRIARRRTRRRGRPRPCPLRRVPRGAAAPDRARGAADARLDRALRGGRAVHRRGPAPAARRARRIDLPLGRPGPAPGPWQPTSAGG